MSTATDFILGILLGSLILTLGAITVLAYIVEQLELDD